MKDGSLILLKKSSILFIGFVIIAFGISISVRGQIGVSPWDVLHQGIANTMNIKFGQVSILVGLTVLILSMSIKIFPGFATVLNIVFIGLFIDVVLPYIPVAPNFYIGVIMNVVGATLMALGTTLYLYAKAGAGPRDSFLMGMIRKYQLDTRYVKPAIEGIVLIIGFILGGNVGVGTIISLLVMGYMMDVFFRLLKFDPKAEKQKNIREQIVSMKEVLKNEGSYS